MMQKELLKAVFGALEVCKQHAALFAFFAKFLATPGVYSERNNSPNDLLSFKTFFFMSNDAERAIKSYVWCVRGL